MKIAYFIGTLKKEDGVARVLLTLIREAKKKGIDSIIITGWAEDASVSPVPVIEIPSMVFPLYKDYRLPLPGMKGFEKKLDEFKPDIIHLHSPDTVAFSAKKYARRHKIPIIATHHSDFSKYLSYYHLSLLRPILWVMLRRLYNQMNLVTTPSTVTTDDLVAHGVKNVKTIPWGVDFDHFSPSFRSLEWRIKILGDKESSTKIIFCICRLTWEKDLKTLAEVYQLLKKDRDDFKMIVAGDGPVRGELEKMMPGAIFLGHIEGKELSSAYASADILLFPSSNETFGNVTIEAMASGVVPVVANAGGSKSLVTEGNNGFLAKPQDPQDFYEKVNRLLDDPTLLTQMRESSLSLAQQFTWSKVFDTMLDIYNKFTN